MKNNLKTQHFYYMKTKDGIEALFADFNFVDVGVLYFINLSDGNIVFLPRLTINPETGKAVEYDTAKDTEEQYLKFAKEKAIDISNYKSPFETLTASEFELLLKNHSLFNDFITEVKKTGDKDLIMHISDMFSGIK